VDFPGSKPPLIGLWQPFVVVELHDTRGEAAKQALELYRLSFSSPAEPPDDQIERLMHKGFYRTLVMYNEEGLVIACAFTIELPCSSVYHVDYFAVRPGMRGGGIGTKFFNSMVDFFRNEAKYPCITLESETRMVPYYLKLKCTDMQVQSDSFGDDKYFLLCYHLTPPSPAPNPLHDTTDTSTLSSPTDWEQVVKDLKDTLNNAAVFVAFC
jgi:GNAT superfamily N-acetyltransferase